MSISSDFVFYPVDLFARVLCNAALINVFLRNPGEGPTAHFYTYQVIVVLFVPSTCIVYSIFFPVATLNDFELFVSVTSDYSVCSVD